MSRLQAGQHRQRRRAVFGTPALTGGNTDSSDVEEEGDEEEAGQDPDELAARQQSGSSAESSGQDDSEAESDDSEGESAIVPLVRHPLYRKTAYSTVVIYTRQGWKARLMVIVAF